MREIIDTDLDGELLNLKIDNLKFNRVKKVENLIINDEVFQLEVENISNYEVDSGIVHNGGGKRKGSIAIYLEPWHADIFDFLELRKNHGKEEMRTRDLFTALWVPDLFMKRVQEKGKWSLMDPSKAVNLHEVYGEEFEKLYLKYEEEGLVVKTVNAFDLWEKILESQLETGTPYMLYKDSANQKSNQKNIGVLHSSNLCTEILEVTNENEIAVCNLASIGLPKCLVYGKKKITFDFKKLFDITYHVTVALNKVIDINYYPIEKTRYSNFKNRPIGIGVQGLADVFAILKFPFDSKDAKYLNSDIFETIYFAALTASKDLAKKYGPYEAYENSPVSKGILQYHMWGLNEGHLSGKWDFTALKEEIKLYGVRNSLLVAPMPTASTSQILGNNECFEPFTNNIYSRRTLSGEHILLNKHLVKDLISLNLWDEKMRLKIINNEGSIQNIDEIPENLKQIYKTVWEIKQKVIIDLAADRGAFIDQSQSMNLFFDDANPSKLHSAHFYGWSKGLKTGMYYLRSKPASKANKMLGIEIEVKEDNSNESEDCIMCSS